MIHGKYIKWFITKKNKDICELNQKFDIVTSSLAFDYVEDFDKLMKNVYRIMKNSAQCVRRNDSSTRLYIFQM